MKHHMPDYRRSLITLATLVWGQSHINSVMFLAYDAVYVTDDDEFATVLEAYIIVTSVHVTQLQTKKEALDHLGLAKKWCISP